MADPKHPGRFAEELKRQAVELCNGGKPPHGIMAGHGLGRPTLRRRIDAINAAGSSRAAGSRTPEQERVVELERENRRLEVEVDVSKQAALMFAREQP